MKQKSNITIYRNIFNHIEPIDFKIEGLGGDREMREQSKLFSDILNVKLMKEKQERFPTHLMAQGLDLSHNSLEFASKLLD